MLIGDTGVCAGPRPLIDEFLSTAIDGVPAEGISELELPFEVRELLSQLPAAMDYGLHGMRAWGVSLSVWLAMSRAYEALIAIFETAAPPAGEDGLTRLRARLRADWRVLERLQITVDHDRDVHLKAYRDGYERSWRALRSPVGPPTLAQAIAPCPEGAMHLATARQLRGILGARFSHGELDGHGRRADRRRAGPLPSRGAGDPGLDDGDPGVAQRVARSPAAEALAQRSGPSRDLLDGLGCGSYPYLFDLLEEELGVRVECTSSGIEVIRPKGRLVRPDPTCCAGIPLANSSVHSVRCFVHIARDKELYMKIKTKVRAGNGCTRGGTPKPPFLTP